MDNSVRNVCDYSPLCRCTRQFAVQLKNINVALSNTLTNHWSSPTYMACVNDLLVGGGPALVDAIANATHDTLSEWVGQELAMTTVFGIRVYKEGAVLSTHVDRLPLVVSAIINVDQDGRSHGS